MLIKRVKNSIIILIYIIYGDVVKLKELLYQIVKFSFAGAIASGIDVGLLAFLKEVFDVEVLLASAISFCASVFVNYVLCMKYVFKSKNDNKTNEFIIFVILSIGGLLVNQLVMFVGAKCLCFYYLWVKLVAVVFEGTYNYITRKIFLEA